MNVHNPRRQRSSKNTRQVVGRPKPNRDRHHKQQGNRKEKLPVILTSRQVLRQIWRNLLDCSHVFLSMCWFSVKWRTGVPRCEYTAVFGGPFGKTSCDAS